MNIPEFEYNVPQPDKWEIHTIDDVFIKQMHLAKAHTLVPQHAHFHSHVTMLAAGSVRVWADGELLGDFHAPTGIHIKSHVKHTFMSLVPNTVLYCIHNMHGLGDVQISEEHQLGGN